jgi:hypothetical protein
VVKQHLLDIAETTDAWRVFPRLFLCLLYTVLADTHHWYLLLDTRGPYEAAYVTAVWGAVAAVTKFYVDSGRNWTGVQARAWGTTGGQLADNWSNSPNYVDTHEMRRHRE